MYTWADMDTTNKADGHYSKEKFALAAERTAKDEAWQAYYRAVDAWEAAANAYEANPTPENCAMYHLAQDTKAAACDAAHQADQAYEDAYAMRYAPTPLNLEGAAKIAAKA